RALRGKRGLSRRRRHRGRGEPPRGCRRQPRLRRRADDRRCPRPLRIHPLDHARRPLPDPVDAPPQAADQRRLTRMPEFYFKRITALIDAAAKTNDAPLDAVATKLCETLAGGGLIHLFGSGHSVLPCQEAFPRYGSYVGFNPLTDPRVMWHNVLGAGGVRELLWLERTENYIDKFLDHQPLNPGDSLIVYSHGGRHSAATRAAV